MNLTTFIRQVPDRFNYKINTKKKFMKTKLYLLLILVASVNPGFLLAQFTQQGPKLIGTGAVGNPLYQGFSVAISSDGNTAVMGGYADNNNAGAAWVFTRSGGAWTQQGPKLVGADTIGAAFQGISVAISSDGNTIMIGGPQDNNSAGAVWVFSRSGGVWTQHGTKLVGTGSQYGAGQGNSVAISSDGNTAIEGGVFDETFTGATWVFTRSGNVWTQQGPKLVGTGFLQSPYQGSSVAISSDGNTAIVGGIGDNFGVGAAWIFARSGGVWTQQGSKLLGTGAVGHSNQGNSVAISPDGNTVFVGGPEDNTYEGGVWVYTRSGSVWTQQGPKLDGTGGSELPTPHQGYSVAISSDGNTFIESGPYDHDTGAVWVFKQSGGIWTQQGTKVDGSGATGNARQGYSVAISSNGDTFIVGGPYDWLGSGAAWVFATPRAGIAPISSELQDGFRLSQNYPNPFNTGTKIRFQISKLSATKVIVYDIMGREVSTLINKQLEPGTYEVDFDGSNFAGGTYFYKLETDGSFEMKKMILIK